MGPPGVITRGYQDLDPCCIYRGGTKTWVPLVYLPRGTKTLGPTGVFNKGYQDLDPCCIYRRGTKTLGPPDVFTKGYQDLGPPGLLQINKRVLFKLI